MIGRTFSHYKILEKLGAGGMGVVYKARDLKLDRTVALKFLPPHLGVLEEESQRVARERFVQEAKAASALDHLNIGTIHEIDDTEDGQTFIAMAFYDGETLKKKITRGPLPVTEAVSMASQIAQGLAKAHEQGIVHRDIKPANVMVTPDGVVKIIDFGLAKLEDATRITRRGTTVGTVAYMSPEQTRGEQADHRADIWSLGVVLYEMLTGELPFRGENASVMIHAILNDEYQPVNELRKDTPVELERIVDRALQKDRQARYPSAAEVDNDLTDYQSGMATAQVGLAAFKPLLQHARRPWIAVPGLLILLVLGWLAVGYFNHRAKVRWAREVAVPEIHRLAEEREWNVLSKSPDDFALEDHHWGIAYELAKRAESYIPEDSMLARLWPLIAKQVTIHSDPPGAKVFRKYYATPEADWEYLGETPLDAVRFPRGFSRLKLEKEGFLTVHAASFSDGIYRPPPQPQAPGGIFLKLDAEGTIPSEMVRVPCGTFRYPLAGLEHLFPIELDDYLLDLHEVTNKEFKRFVESGGYEEEKYFKYPFVEGERVLTWQEAMARFKDRTGRPGPATWEVGDFPEGQDDYPVTGVSWYEAAAYGEFVGKSLPTVFHWSAAAQMQASSYVVPLSNFDGRGPAPTGSHEGLTAYGNHDMAGNVREWCWNATGSQRFIMGGGWNDPLYLFTELYAQPPFDRSPINGFRCVEYLGTDENLESLKRPLNFEKRDYRKEKPASYDQFELYRSLYAYDKTELNARVESVDESSEDWTIEKVSFDAAYGEERVIAHLFIPKSVDPPYQTIIFFPGAHAIYRPSIQSVGFLGTIFFDFVIKSGRAVMYPTYKSTYERRDGLTAVRPNESHFYRDHVIQWVKDFSRSIDYLETRTDVDAEKLAYLGTSWGGYMGGLIPAIEKRLKASVLRGGGFRFESRLPEVDPLHFVSRIDTPVLMVNGRYDDFFPVDTMQIPFFEMLGTPPEHKRHVVFESGHNTPRNEYIKETLDWLDRYLGPIE